MLWEEISDNIKAVDSVSNQIPAFSTIDHFVSNYGVKDAGVKHRAENSSNHSPIFAKFEVGALQVEVEPTKSTPRTNWSKSGEDSRNRYKSTATANLDQVIVSDCNKCDNVCCTEHAEDIQECTLNVFQAVEDV